jgi:choline dehydrogenase
MSEFDYIVVGAGSSGCVVASRLSEDPNTRVLLIEAGGSPEKFWVRAPAGMGRLFLEKSINWAYFTEPVPQARGRKIYWPRGRVLGGSSSVNGMVYLRGNPEDFNGWARLGGEGWAWEDVLPFFLKSEDNARGASEYHGAGGPMRVADPTFVCPTIEDYFRSAENAGIRRTFDHNAPPYEGADVHQHTIRNGRRESAYTAFIKPVQHRRNLTVLTGTQVLRVVFRGRTAIGVEVRKNGRDRTIAATREIVLSSGSLNSPQLLMVSGIGAGADLRRLGIDVRVDLPGVGKNLQDHWFSPMIWRTRADSSFNYLIQGWRKYLSGAQYLLSHGGLLSNSASQSAAFVRSSDAQARPDLQMVLRPLSYTFSDSGAVIPDRFPGISGGLVLLNPASRGHMEIVSADPTVAPRFHPNYLDAADDAERTVKAVHLMRKIMATDPIASRIEAEIAPGPQAIGDDAILEHVRAVGNCGWHQVGTCRMGSDEGAVVDPRLRVRGVERLRIADGSIMPTITSGNTAAPCVMIGEKAAAMIAEDRGGPGL